MYFLSGASSECGARGGACDVATDSGCTNVVVVNPAGLTAVLRGLRAAGPHVFARLTFCPASVVAVAVAAGFAGASRSSNVCGACWVVEI